MKFIAVDGKALEYLHQVLLNWYITTVGFVFVHKTFGILTVEVEDTCTSNCLSL